MAVSQMVSEASKDRKGNSSFREFPRPDVQAVKTQKAGFARFERIISLFLAMGCNMNFKGGLYV